VPDRNYFTSFYFREPGGVLFEVSTARPGFMIDEDKDHLGEALKLPPWFETDREKIEKVLKPVQTDLKKYQ
jgi:glyoxalase family protein